MNIMRSNTFICLLTLLVIVLVCTAGCTFSRNPAPGPTTTVPPVVTSPTASSPPVQSTTSTPTLKMGVIDTTIDIHYKDYDCLDVTQQMGVVYLNPDQKYMIRVSPPNPPVNVNVLLVDVGDKEKLPTSPPVWNAITKTWDYEGIVPLVQFNDVSTPVEKTITIKNQGKYYLCADDRTGSAANDAVIRVPVKMTRVA
jgi:hypothetical protein